MSVWLGAESILLLPVRKILRLFRRSISSPSGTGATYVKEVEEKHRMAERHPLLAKVYVWLVLFDYGLQYAFKRLGLSSKKILLLDRYFYDVAVNLAVALGWDEDQLIAFISRHFHRFGFPDVRFYVRVPPDVSMARKDDIPDAGYLALRLSFYDRIAQDFGFVVLDGTRSIDQNGGLIQEAIDSRADVFHVHYVHSNNYDLGGADFCMARMAEEVQKRGYGVTASLRLRTQVASAYAEAGVPLFVYPFCRPQLSRGFQGLLVLPFSAGWSLVYFIRLLLRIRPDIVHVNDLYDFVPAMAAWILRIPVVYHIRMIRTRKTERLIFARLVGLTSKASVSVSDAVRSAYFKTSETTAHSARVIYDWPNDTFIEESDLPCPDEFQQYPVRVLMVGRLEEWKGQHIFVEAVAQLSEEERKGVGFFLVGGRVTGAEKERYADAVLAAAEKARVIWLGERRDVRNLLSWTDVSVHASTTPDPFPGVVLESLLSRSAVIGANAGGVAEMIEDKVHGLLVTPGKAGELAHAISALLGSKELRETLAKNGRERILAMCRKEEILSVLIGLYRELKT